MHDDSTLYSTFYSILQSPIGDLLLLSNGEALTGLYMDAQKHRPQSQSDWRRDEHPFIEAKAQLNAYFAKELTQFDLPLQLHGTEFQRRVWAVLGTIPFGRTASYRDIAQCIRAPRAVRAVGLANGCNPIAIVVPCHRVIGSNGQLTGYGGGLPRKRWLLAHEADMEILGHSPV